MTCEPECFGAIGDGVADDTAAVQEWASRLGNGVNGEMRNTYLISAAIIFTDKTAFEASGGGTVKMADGAGTSEANSIFLFNRCTFWKMRDLTFDGNRDNRTPAEASGHLFKVFDGGDFELTNLKANNGTTDGFFISAQDASDVASHPRRFRMINCHADNNYRQGMSIINAHDFRIEGGSYTNTNGTAPQAGIDLETDNGDPTNSIENGVLSGVLFEGNAGWGLDIATKKEPIGITVVDCVFRNNQLGAIQWGAVTGTIVRPLIDGMVSAGNRGVIDLKAGNFPRSGYCYIVNPTFKDLGFIDDDHPLIYEHTAANSVATVVDVRTENVNDPLVILNGAGSSISDNEKLRV